MHKSRLGDIVIDCRTDDLMTEAGFWSNALGYPLPDGPDESGRFIKLVTPPGEVQVIIQRVGHDPRAHLDIETDSIPAEVAHLEALGAVLVEGWLGRHASAKRTSFLRRQAVSRWLRGGG